MQDARPDCAAEDLTRPGPGPGPAAARPLAWPGPAARPLAWPGPAAAWYFVFILFLQTST